MNKTGFAVLVDPLLNKGTAFTAEERAQLGLQGLLPAGVQTIEQQEREVYERFLAEPTDLAKRIYLMGVRDSNARLFFYSMERHLTEYMPIVYAPTVAQSIENYDEHYFGSKVAYVSVDHPELVEESLRAFAGEGADIRLVVATDSEGILGIGDWGTNGAEILTGKLAVYTAAASIDPAKILPVMVDAGTNRKELLDDPRYLGNRFERVRGQRYDDLIQALVDASLKLYPSALLHWEDFGRPCAAPILERYRDTVLTLNDDIQGTGVTVLGALMAATKVADAPLSDSRILTFGAGTAGIGIADQIVDGLEKLGGLTSAEARSRVYLVDRDGLILKGMPDLTEGQVRYAHDASEFAADLKTTSLAAVVDAVRPTALIGTSTVHGAFTEDVVRAMASHVEHPFIAPISNPTKLAEATAADVIRWSEGRASVVTGTPSAPVDYDGVTYHIGQGNNALMYPGICLGALIPSARIVSRGMLLAGAQALADMIDTSQPGAPVLPPMSDLTQITRNVATAVAERALEEGLNRVEVADVGAAIDAAAWHPEY
ncbi:NAD-dependent malic enzyme [Thermophilibacter immobilis]|uniref:NAD-dependent malic enzyme n=1 Tax=Thermophilibacter immobilis TaxID=2779519 RepID=A0A7S7RTV9_9ACTN|nr:NAD-dependent malic enzyme [Thermophilibacter immobilis]QOY59792.1 NAD-dependent malic enzyme [Thermophilibacter immobilis]